MVADLVGYLSTRKAAAYCDMGYSTFRAVAKSDGLRPDGFAGKRARYKPSSLDRWLRFRRDFPKAS